MEPQDCNHNEKDDTGYNQIKTCFNLISIDNTYLLAGITISNMQGWLGWYWDDEQIIQDCSQHLHSWLGNNTSYRGKQLGDCSKEFWKHRTLGLIHQEWLHWGDCICIMRIHRNKVLQQSCKKIQRPKFPTFECWWKNVYGKFCPCSLFEKCWHWSFRSALEIHKNL